jgi:hypothetical protein
MKLAVKIENKSLVNKTDWAEFWQRVKEEGDGWLQIDVRHTRRRPRSNPQNRYYFGTVVPAVCKGLREVGYDVDIDATHEYLAATFLPSQTIDIDGNPITLRQSTADLNTTEFSQYVDRISIWASEYLSISIPLPNENIY